MRLLACFDIACDKKRRKLVDVLLTYGKRCQYSVFEMNINAPLYRKFLDDINKFDFVDNDKFFVYPIPLEHEGRIVRIGEYLKDEDVFYF